MNRSTLRGLLVLAAVAAVAVAAAVSASATSRVAPQITLSGTGSPRTGDAPASGAGDVTQVEFAGETDAAALPDYPGSVVDRSLSGGTGRGPTIGASGRTKSNPTFVDGFAGLNLYDQRYARKGNQFTVEPPDQGMCVGNGRVLEVVNDVLDVYDTSGTSVLPDNTSTNVVGGYPRNVDHAVDLNSFFGYAPAINRTTGVRAQFVTDPSCIYDAATQRWFVVVLTLETHPNGAYTLQNHLDLAVSRSADPTGSWNVYRLDVTGDGSNPDPSNQCPCLGDYPHMGIDANGVYLTTNAYPWLGNGFDGAQIYAISKADLVAGAPTPRMQHIDTFGLVNAPSDAGATQPGFTVWPAQSPGTGSFAAGNGGTEYFLSSNAADEATHPVAGSGGNYQSSQLVVWTMTNTSSLNTATPAVALSNRVITVEPYAIPPKQNQPGSGGAPGTNAPQGYCLDDTTTATVAGVGCWRLLVGSEPAHDEVVSRPDSNDTRMQQVDYANGKLWGSLDTGLTIGSESRAGVAWFVLNPSSGAVVRQGYLGANGYDFTYPAIGVTASGRGVMAFTVTGVDPVTGAKTYPSAGYASIDALAGVGGWNLVPGGQGAAPDDGFTSYKAQVGNPPRTRWGDYGAAAVDGNDVWVASEITAPQGCDYTPWGGPFFTGGTGDNLLGTCGGASHGPGPRTALGNWSTFVSEFTP